MRKEQLVLKRNEALNESTHLLTLELDPEICAECQPGQFYNLRPLDSSAPLLRRPISICDARPEDGEMDLLVRIVGDGTSLVCSRRPGAKLDVMGPLGNPFEIDTTKPAVMIAGGVGVAPVYFLSRRIWEAARIEGKKAPEIHFLYGARTASDFVLLPQIVNTVTETVLTTEDGSRGTKGFVTSVADEYLTSEYNIYVCGPSPMMQVLLDMVHAKGVSAFFSLENQMGCGVGACMGCVVPGKEGLIRVCCDGPVIPSDKLENLLID
ncbi:MAG: dihydroorotate dehydrogenase electron transfer subunit [Candidatus Sumerlaeia bacterium]